MTSAFVTRAAQSVLLGLLLIVGALMAGSQARAQSVGVESVQPAQGSVVATATDTIEAAFSAPVSVPAGETPFHVYGGQSGKCEGSVQAAGDTLRFVPDCPFRPGEQVSVVLSDAVTVGGAPLGTPYVWQFTVRSEYGTGTFSSEQPVALGGGARTPVKVGGVTIPPAVQAADFNEDLLTDVALVNQKTETVQVRYGSTLETADSLAMPGAVTLAEGDLTGNGRPDLVTVHSFQDSLGIVQNQQGGLVRTSKISTGPRPTDVAVADLNGDGAQDLVVTPFGGSGAVVHFNDGTGDFSAGQSVPGSAALTSVVVRDVDRDGDLDLLVASASAEAIQWLENNGTGAFTVGGRVSLPGVPSTLSARDVFGAQGGTVGDGWVDLVVGMQDTGRIFGYENEGTGGFSFTQRALPAPEEPARSTVFADLDAETESTYDLDLLSTHRDLGRFQTTLNQSNNGYRLGERIETSLEPVGSANMDLDRDGDQDYVVAGPQGTQVQVFRNQGGRPSPVALSRTSIAFGAICVGEDSTASVEVQSRTNQPVLLTAESVPDGFAVESSLPDTLQPKQSRTLQLTFAPEQIDDFSGPFLLGVNELTELCGRPTPPQEAPIQLTGTGAGIDVSAQPDTLSFGEIYTDSTSSRSTTLVNRGNIEADVVGVNGLDDSPFSVAQSPEALPAEGERAATFIFDPAQADRAYVDTAEVVTTGDCGNDTTRVVLRGRTKADRADLVAEQLDVVEGAADSVRATQSRGVVCQFSNQGRAGASAFAVAIRRDDNLVRRLAYDSLGVNQQVRTDTVDVPFPTEGTSVLSCTVDDDQQVTERREDNNTVERSIEVAPPPAPDLAADQLTPVETPPSPLRVSDSLAFVCSLSNRGSEDAEGPFAAEITRNGTVIRSVSYDSLAVGRSVQTDTTTVPLVSEGATTVACTVDPAGNVDERGRTDNNTVERTYTVQPPPAPDLVAAEVRAVEGSPSNARVADTLSVVCEYGNQGEEDTPSSFAVRIAQGGTERRVFDVPGVAMGETRQTDPVPVALQDQGETEISCTVDPNEQIDERGRLDNNTAVLPVSVQRPEQLPVSPNPFTPNGDGVNDAVRFKVERYGLTQPVLSVYTFNGRQLRTIDQLQGGELRWDGTDASGSAQPPGVYLYVVRDGGRTVASGHITLAR